MNDQPTQKFIKHKFSTGVTIIEFIKQSNSTKHIFDFELKILVECAFLDLINKYIEK